MNVKHVFISLCLLLLDCCCNLYNMIEYIYIFIQVDCKSKSFNFNSVFFFFCGTIFFFVFCQNWLNKPCLIILNTKDSVLLIYLNLKNCI